jgi:hypothetical protein
MIALFVPVNADGNADSPRLVVHEIRVAMPTFEYRSLISASSSAIMRGIEAGALANCWSNWGKSHPSQNARRTPGDGTDHRRGMGADRWNSTDFKEKV